MKVLFLTNEFPPHVYGGAGVHVDYLSHELSQLMDIKVYAFGEHSLNPKRPWVTGFNFDPSKFKCPKHLHSMFGAIQRCIDFNTTDIDGDIGIVHCHTWYSHFGGILARLIYNIPLVLTVHSLEPLRPWKREQLGGGYEFSCWVERTALEMADAIVAVSQGTREDVLRCFPDVHPDKVHVIYNGIDPEEYYRVKGTGALERHGIDPARPFVLFVGRITRQKGIVHLANAIRYMDPGYQVVLCAGAADTPEIGAEMAAAVAAGREGREGVIWINEMVDKQTVYELYSNAAVFCCPSIYEPFGIINLEAMACQTPVVASAVGGIKEVVVDGETGFLVPLEQQAESPFEPVDPDQFSRDLADGINRLMADPDMRRRFGEAGRRRVLEMFSWKAIAAQTRDLYQSLIKT